MAILFTYYRNPTTCRERVRILRRLNPGVPIYGLSTGDFALELDASFVHEPADPGWLWRNYDRVICHWYRAGGSDLPWDFLFVHSWDLLLLEPVATFMEGLESDGVLLPGLRSVAEMDERVLDPAQPPEVAGRWTWLGEPSFREFSEYVARRWGDVPLLCEVSPFAILSRPACEKYNAVADEVPGMNEYRFATVANALGVPFARPRLPDWFWKRYDPDRRPVTLETVLAGDSKLYHPVYYPVTCEELWPAS